MHITCPIFCSMFRWVFTFCIFSLGAQSWGSDSSPLELSASLGEHVAIKYVIEDEPNKEQRPQEKLNENTHSLSILGHESLPDGIEFEARLPDKKSRHTREIPISLHVSYKAPSFEKLPLTIKVVKKADGTVVSSTPVSLTVRPELKIYVAETATGEALWSSPKDLALPLHPEGLLLRVINQTLTPLEEPFRLHFQGHDTVKHSESSEVLSEFGDEYSYWIPESQQSSIQYRLHYREQSSDIRSIEFGQQEDRSQAHGASHEH